MTMKQFLRWLTSDNSAGENRIALEDSMRALVEVRVLQEIAKLREYNRRDLEDIRKEELKNWKTLSLVLAFLTIFVTFLMWFYTNHEMASQIKEAVDAKMIEPNLEGVVNTTIQKRASGYIDRALSPFALKVDAMAKQISQIDTLSQHISSLDDTIKKANDASANLQNKLNNSDTSIASLNQLAQSTHEQLNIIAAIVQADNDDKDALDVLVSLANDAKSPYRGLALEVVLAVTGHASFVLPINPIPWEQIGFVNPDSISIESIKTKFPTLGRADIKEAVEQYVWDNTKFTKHDKLDFLIWIIENDHSIAAINNAHVLCDNEAHLKQNILGNQIYIDWWNKNKDSYK